VHKKANLPRDEADARKILLRLPHWPSIIVHSGHGLQCWWLFEKPLGIEAEADRRFAMALAKGWTDHVRKQARAAGGWDVDATGDLARVMRPPGTFNRKGGEPVEVRIIEDHPDCRYNPCDFEIFAAEDAVLATPGVENLTLILRPDAEPPAEKFAELVQACPAFVQAWNRQGPDLQDQSQSAYGLSLADIAALNGWSDQEIASLLIAARRKHGEKPEKALRADYVAKTIGTPTAVASRTTSILRRPRESTAARLPQGATMWGRPAPSTGPSPDIKSDQNRRRRRLPTASAQHRYAAEGEHDHRRWLGDCLRRARQQVDERRDVVVVKLTRTVDVAHHVWVKPVSGDVRRAVRQGHHERADVVVVHRARPIHIANQQLGNNPRLVVCQKHLGGQVGELVLAAAVQRVQRNFVNLTVEKVTRIATAQRSGPRVPTAD